MVAWFKKYKKLLILIFDAVLLLFTMLCKPLSDYMLKAGEDCVWKAYGIQCFTCGGTHFVNTLLSGKFIEAFNHHQYLFLLTLFLAVSLLLINLYLLFDLPFALKGLKWMYNIPVLIIGVVVLAAFFIWRNWQFIIDICEKLIDIVKGL